MFRFAMDTHISCRVLGIISNKRRVWEMAEKKSEEEKDGKTAAKKTATKKTAEKKEPAKKAAAGKQAKKKPEEEPKAAEKPPKEEIEAMLAEEQEAAPEKEPEPFASGEKEEGLSEEELRRLVEESLEKVTVADIVLNVMNQLASVGYMKMGLPESVNLKYRDFSQARLAIDTLEAMIKGAEGKLPEELLQPFKGTLANLQMNFVQLSRR
jgi:flagellar biosynthesis GTPase FlhF